MYTYKVYGCIHTKYEVGGECTDDADGDANAIANNDHDDARRTKHDCIRLLSSKTK